MFKTTITVEGMFCGMCEAHINDVIRKTVPGAKKVSSSHSKGKAVFISEEAADWEALKAAIDATGYTALSVETEVYEKKGLFSGGFLRLGPPDKLL